MICITYWTNWSDITAIAKLLATACLLLAVPIICTAIVPVIALVLVAVVKTVIVAALAASPLLIIKLQKAYRL